MKTILALTDYKGNFGSKHYAVPYRSGMEKEKLRQYFKEYGFNLTFATFSEIDLTTQNYRGVYVIYTSSEDPFYYYKDYIEDQIFALQLAGANVIPLYEFLRANNNKVFMELLREIILPSEFCKLKTFRFGTTEEMLTCIDQINFPVVVKGSGGASGTQVSLAENKRNLLQEVKKISKTFHIKNYLWEIGRSFRHKGYKKDSMYRKKYILQEFIPNLKKDWKILVFGQRYFILTRYVREDDFRASGSQNNYKAGIQSELTYQILDFAKQVYDNLEIPHISLDIAFDGKKYYLLEMQGVYFGTSTIYMSDAYFVKGDNGWSSKEVDLDLEKLYADCIYSHIIKKKSVLTA
ncbi:hypothetical protein ABW636_05020 [Aquimarina sp. 2201CG1-2-11]|uniref:ATP-grasp domain-containing protein n=1 Tax=Aquimarina discodermiae TaxID=3231043 RepID=UPI0034619E17